MNQVTMKDLLSAGVHFGHQTSKWNPKMKPYIFGARNGIYIVDLQKTVKLAQKALEFIRDYVGQGKNILFVGTKVQAKDVIKEEAEKAEAFYVTHRWLGGLLTNFNTIRKGIERWEEIERMKTDGVFELLSKKEISRIERERKKLEETFSGIRQMKNIPDFLFVIDPNHEDISIKEAKKLGIPVVALVDTNCDPEPVDYVIPGNDDAIKSIKLFAEFVSDAVREGRAMYQEKLRAEGVDPEVLAAKEQGDSARQQANVQEEEGSTVVVEKIRKLERRVEEEN
ncbi:MAG: 30S ribosomal protein S2 [Oligoflexia bacterium]|nr:30S ribosomal protein S2 [Oligoflexia bacterium]